jgi:hypothetical protein
MLEVRQFLFKKYKDIPRETLEPLINDFLERIKYIKEAQKPVKRPTFRISLNLTKGYAVYWVREDKFYQDVIEEDMKTRGFKQFDVIDLKSHPEEYYGAIYKKYRVTFPSPGDPLDAYYDGTENRTYRDSNLSAKVTAHRDKKRAKTHNKKRTELKTLMRNMGDNKIEQLKQALIKAKEAKAGN